MANHYCCFRVKNLDNFVEFYTRVLDMKLIKRMDNKGNEYSLAWLGYGDEYSDICLELTYNWDNREYSHGTYFGQLVLGVPDVYAATKTAEENGATVIRRWAFERWINGDFVYRGYRRLSNRVCSGYTVLSLG